jgi:hypothetical protein
MKTIFKHLKFAMLLLLVSCSANAQTSIKENEYEKTKKFTQTYELDGNDKVSLGNQFGNIKVITWADKKIKVDVEIEVGAKTEAKATKILDGISIKHSKNDGLVSFKTKIEGNGNYNNNSNVTSTKTDTKGNTKTSTTISTKTSATVITKTNKDGETETVNIVGDDENCNCSYGKNSQSMKINYTVYLPATTTLKMYNEFGNTTVGDYEGALTINNEYGNFFGGILSNDNNEINIEYGSAEIKSLKNPSFNIGYGGCDIGNIVGTGTLNFDYCSDVSLGINKEVGDLKIGNDYSTLEVTVNENTNAIFVINSSYGEVKNKNKTLLLKTEKDDDEGCCNFTKKHEGKIGTGKARIKIDNEYGKVKFR